MVLEVPGFCSGSFVSLCYSLSNVLQRGRVARRPLEPFRSGRLPGRRGLPGGELYGGRVLLQFSPCARVYGTDRILWSLSPTALARIASTSWSTAVCSMHGPQLLSRSHGDGARWNERHIIVRRSPHRRPIRFYHGSFLAGFQGLTRTRTWLATEAGALHEDDGGSILSELHSIRKRASSGRAIRTSSKTRRCGRCSLFASPVRFPSAHPALLSHGRRDSSGTQHGTLYLCSGCAWTPFTSLPTDAILGRTKSFFLQREGLLTSTQQNDEDTHVAGIRFFSVVRPRLRSCQSSRISAQSHQRRVTEDSLDSAPHRDSELFLNCFR